MNNASCTPDSDIYLRFYPGIENLIYPCYLTEAGMGRLYIGCIGTHEYGRQLTSVLC